MTPVFIGSAYKNKGVQLLLDGVNLYLPNPTEVANIALDQNKDEEKVVLVSEPKKPFVGLAFKLEDGRYGQLTYMRIYQGTLNKGDFIVNNSPTGKRVKVPRLVRMHSDEMEDIESATAGDIVALFGVECASGDTFTDEAINYAMTSMYVPEAVISLAVAPKDKAHGRELLEGAQPLHQGGSDLPRAARRGVGETIISGMGELHLEIYIERMKREYAAEVDLGQAAGRLPRGDQPAGRVQLHPQEADRRLGPVRQGRRLHRAPARRAPDRLRVRRRHRRRLDPARVHPGLREGLPRGDQEGAAHRRPGRRREVRRQRRRLARGRLVGNRVPDGGALGFREAYARAKPTILEPIMRVEVQVPEEFQGAVLGQIMQRRGIIISTEKQEGFVQAMAEVPLDEMFGYSTDLRSATQGKAEFTMEFQKYAEVPKQQREVMMAEFRNKKEKESVGRAVSRARLRAGTLSRHLSRGNLRA